MEQSMVRSGGGGAVHPIERGHVVASKLQASVLPVPPGYSLKPTEGRAMAVSGAMRAYRGASEGAERAEALKCVRAQLMRTKTEIDRQMALGGNAQGAGEKRKAHGVPASRKEQVEANRSARLERLMQQCSAIIRQIHKERPNEYDVFKEPVDPNKYGCYDYYDVIKNPMDFGTMLQKIKNKEYLSPEEFKDDAQLVFSNCFTYNREGSPVNAMGKRVQDFFWKKWKAQNIEPAWQKEKEKRAAEDVELERLGESIPDGAHRQPQQYGQQRQQQKQQYKELEYEEKLWLTENVTLLFEGDRGEEHTENVKGIIEENSEGELHDDELDIDALPIVTQNKMHEYVLEHYEEVQREQQKQKQQQDDEQGGNEASAGAASGGGDGAGETQLVQGQRAVTAGASQPGEAHATSNGDTTVQKQNEQHSELSHGDANDTESGGGPQPANIGSWMQIAENEQGLARQSGADGADGPAASSGAEHAPAESRNVEGGEEGGTTAAATNGDIWNAFQEKQRVREEKSKERAEIEERERQEKEEEQEQKRRELEVMQQQAKQQEEEQRRQRQEAAEAEQRRLEQQKEEERKRLEQQAKEATGMDEEREKVKQMEAGAGGSFLAPQGQQPTGGADESSDDDDDDDEDDDDLPP
jgi:hypothetical protein